MTAPTESEKTVTFQFPVLHAWDQRSDAEVAKQVALLMPSLTESFVQAVLERRRRP